ncbi:MAG: hypothetical protein GY847_41760 [Proteobacteria bacterium]|nr:hypothetical protein [Pseudomonadota bacterium]
MELALKLPTCEYKRREPEQDLPHQVLCENLETFLGSGHTEEFDLSKHVVKELREYLRCGVLAYGFVSIRCNDCKKSMAVAYSCKGRGFCPSCTGRRMADTSARLLDGVFPPNAPVRQWILSLPINESGNESGAESGIFSILLVLILRAMLGSLLQAVCGSGSAFECMGELGYRNVLAIWPRGSKTQFNNCRRRKQIPIACHDSLYDDEPPDS